MLKSAEKRESPHEVQPVNCVSLDRNSFLIEIISRSVETYQDDDVVLAVFSIWDSIKLMTSACWYSLPEVGR